MQPVSPAINLAPISMLFSKSLNTSRVTTNTRGGGYYFNSLHLYLEVQTYRLFVIAFLHRT